MTNETAASASSQSGIPNALRLWAEHVERFAYQRVGAGRDASPHMLAQLAREAAGELDALERERLHLLRGEIKLSNQVARLTAQRRAAAAMANDMSHRDDCTAPADRDDECGCRLADMRALLAPGALTSAIEAGTGETACGLDAQHESAVPQADAPPPSSATGEPHDQ